MRIVSMSVLAAGCTFFFAASGLAQMSGQTQSSPQQQAQPDQQQLQQAQKEAQQQAQQQQQQQAQRFMEPDKFTELKVQDIQGKEIGKVDQVVLDADQGRIAFILVKSGGAFGGGEKKIIPWNAVKFQQPGQQQAQQGQQGQQQGKEEAMQTRDQVLPGGDQGGIRLQ